MSTRVSIFLIFIWFSSGCAMTRAVSSNMLEKRSDLGGIHEVEASLQGIDKPLLEPVRSEPVIADIWVHAHELPNGDYFRGAWIRTIVSKSAWQIKETRPLIIKNAVGKGRVMGVK